MKNTYVGYLPVTAIEDIDVASERIQVTGPTSDDRFWYAWIYGSANVLEFKHRWFKAVDCLHESASCKTIKELEERIDYYNSKNQEVLVDLTGIVGTIWTQKY